MFTYCKTKGLKKGIELDSIALMLAELSGIGISV